MDKVNYIALYIKCDEYAYPYHVLHKYNNENTVYNNVFKDMKSANIFLKELYENVPPIFLHYNYTMPEYNAKSKDAYFFNMKNDVIKNASEYDGLAKPVYNMEPLKKAYKELFEKKLNLTESKIRQEKTEATEKTTKQKIKEFVIPFGIAVAVCSPVAFLMYQVNDAHNKLKQAEESVERAKEMEKKIQKLEAETIKLNMMMDTIKQNNR